jgi:hypothetical protein
MRYEKRMVFGAGNGKEVFEDGVGKLGGDGVRIEGGIHFAAVEEDEWREGMCYDGFLNC